MKGLLVGYGSVGRRHLRNLHALGVKDWGVVHSARGTLAFEPPCPVRTYAGLEEALDIEQPAFAVIATPTALHVDAAIACAVRGCSLLLEKPVSHRVDEDLERLQSAVHEHGARVLVGYQYRLEPGLRRVAALLRGGEIGRPLHALAVWGEYLPAAHPWEDFRVGYAARADLGGGVHHSLSHPLDYLRMLLGEVRTVTATLQLDGPLHLEVAEAADATLLFESGASAQLHLDSWSRPGRHRLEIMCTAGAVSWDYFSGEVRHTAADGEWTAERFAGLAGRDDLFVDEARHFLDVAAGRTDPLCSLDDGVKAVELAVAIETSRGLPVELPGGPPAVEHHHGAGHVRRGVGT